MPREKFMNNRMTQQEYDRKLDSMKLCGANRGPHDYIPIAWTEVENTKTERNSSITTMMCRVCFNRISLKTIYDHFKEST